MAKKPRKARMSRARNSAAEPGRAVGSSLAAPAAEPSTGLEGGVATRTVPGRNGGTLTPHEPGSNGGVHRGPDKFPRANVMRAVVMMSLAASGLTPGDLPTTFRQLQAIRRKTHKKLVPAAMAHLMVRANMNIVEEAAMGDRAAYGRFLQLQRDFHQIMAGGNGDGHGKNASGGGEPFPSRFVSQGQVAATGQPTPASPEPGPGLVVDGQEYVRADG